MKNLFSRFGLIVVVLFFSSCERQVTMVGTFWKYSQEYPIEKYLNFTEEQVEKLGFSGELKYYYDLKFLSGNEAKMKIQLYGTIYQQFEMDSVKIVYKKVNETDQIDMTYTLKGNGWSGMLTAVQESELWQHPPVKFTLYENTIYLILEIDNQEVIFEMVDPLDVDGSKL